MKLFRANNLTLTVTTNLSRNLLSNYLVLRHNTVYEAAVVPPPDDAATAAEH
ncbi:hypothetical protein [Pontibacter qinzhouensis]|uniref:hypothetical protein n=1 Tax=Pontibacter qinzhouensis TaxID=2603253 RepID=UPI0016505D26|nr:hypothetical protein [Pontibacter qinzhouensis]